MNPRENNNGPSAKRRQPARTHRNQTAGDLSRQVQSSRRASIGGAASGWMARQRHEAGEALVTAAATWACPSRRGENGLRSARQGMRERAYGAPSPMLMPMFTAACACDCTCRGVCTCCGKPKAA